MNLDLLIKKALRLEFLNTSQALEIYNRLPLGELIYTANELKEISIIRKIMSHGSSIGTSILPMLVSPDANSVISIAL